MTIAVDPKKIDRSVVDLVADVKQLTQEIQSLYTLDDVPWIIGYSGGKDSSAVLQMVWKAIVALPKKQRKKTIHVISTDTLVENPIVAAWVRQSQTQLKQAAQKQKLPFEPHLLTPNLQDTYWVNLIGKGYPAPRNKFRWCTERLKINPSNSFIRDKIRTHGETILVLGTRKAESSQRAYAMSRHEQKRLRDRLSPNAALPNSLIYSPIEDWSNHDVWLYLHSHPNPWSNEGQNLNKDLFTMYRGATADNECPLVVDTTTPSCGSSRFGCWVCTLVDRDKSMEAMILNDDEKEWMEPLLALRDELDFRSDDKRKRERERRDFRRLSGRVQLFERNGDDGNLEVVPIPGPYIKPWREELLRKVLQTEQSVRENAPPGMNNIELISQAELQEIRRIWRDNKHEFEDALPRIYLEVTGKKFQDSHPVNDGLTLGSEEWQILEEICGDDPMHVELVARLLSTESKYQTMSRRQGIYEALEKCFDTSARTKETAIEHAHTVRDLKQATEDGDVSTLKKITKQPKTQKRQSKTKANKSRT